MPIRIVGMILLMIITIATIASASGLEVVAKLEEPPGNIAVTSDGRIFLSLHPFFSPEQRVVELLDDGRIVPFPNASWNRSDGPVDSTLDSVLGIAADTSGTVWMLDTGRRRTTVPRLIGWDTRGDSLARVIELPPPVTPADAFVNDLAIDQRNRKIYIADPAGGHNAALIVVDPVTGKARRLLEGHKSVLPGAIDLVVDGKTLEAHVGVNPIAIGPFGYWLYIGPMHGRSLYRVRTADLSDEYMDAEELAGRTERYSDKPICDGIVTDRSGNIYLGDLSANAIGVISRTRTYSPFIEDPRLSWVDAFSLSPDGKLYAVTNQLHRSPALNDGKDVAKRPFLIFRFDPVPSRSKQR